MNMKFIIEGRSGLALPYGTRSNWSFSIVVWPTVYHVPRRLRRGVDPFDAHKAWQDHLDRLAAIDRLYPSRYGLYLRDRAYPITDFSTPAAPLAHLAPFSSLEPRSLKGIEYEPDNKPHWGTGKFYWAFHARNHPHARSWACLLFRYDRKYLIMETRTNCNSLILTKLLIYFKGDLLMGGY